MALAMTISISSTAFGFGLKNLIKTDEQKQPATYGSSKYDQSTYNDGQNTKPSNAPLKFENTKFGYSLQTDGGWQMLTGDTTSNMVMFHNPELGSGGFTINATPMASDFPIETSLQAQEKDYNQRQGRGELNNYYRKDFEVSSPDGKTTKRFMGYVTIESNKDNDPDIQRMQWIGYSQNHNYYNFTWSTNKDTFDTSLAEFEKILGSIQFK